ncbi:MAG: hypothetical protein JWL62_3474 [Hyphomicrobiales bacterium]|nr:hypothetical protein [Hyphomicrobiales bacterium]
MLSTASFVPAGSAALLVALFLAGCAREPSSYAGETAPIAALAEQKARPDPSLEEPCASPVSRPAGAAKLSAGAVERLWSTDRTALRDCKTKHEKTVGFYRSRDATLAGGRP